MSRNRQRLILVGLITSTWLIPASSAGVDPSPTSALESRGLKADGWIYVLKDEAEFHAKVIDARSRFQEWRTSMAPIEQQAQLELDIAQLTAESNEAKQYIAQLRQQMSSNGYGGARAAQFHRMRNQMLSGEINQAQSYLNSINQQLAQLRKNVSNPKDRTKATEEESQRRTALHDAVDELIKQAGTIQARYHELHHDQPTQTALTALSRRDNAKFRLGPSLEYQADLKVVVKLKHELAESGSPIRAAVKSKKASRKKSAPSLGARSAQ